MLVDHGSRERAANRQLAEVAAALARRMPGRSIATAHLAIARPTVADAIAACVAAGAREVVVMPCFLAPGRHATRDVPLLARAEAKRHPGVRVRVSAALGAHAGVIAAVADRIRAAERAMQNPRSASRRGSR